jgi:succinate dehydrogenase/fumarate reductase flavoprotein subunit
MLLRANPTSEGDGLRLAEAAGAEYVDGRGGFYGHLVPYPLSSFEKPDFISIAMLHSGYCLLFDKAGARFTDESLGDHENNQKVLRAPDARALLIADDQIRRERTMAPYIPGMDSYDKFALARQKGAHVVIDAPTLDELVAGVAGWGYDPGRLKASIEDYNRLARDAPEDLSPPSTRHCRPMDVAPLFAMEVQSAITFSYGGIRVDPTSRVVGKDGPIAGLLAAGVDIGGVYTRAYAGGLARGLVFGRRAALTAAGKEQ